MEINSYFLFYYMLFNFCGKPWWSLNFLWTDFVTVILLIDETQGTGQSDFTSLWCGVSNVGRKINTRRRIFLSFPEIRVYPENVAAGKSISIWHSKRVWIITTKFQKREFRPSFKSSVELTLSFGSSAMATAKLSSENVKK